MKVNRDEGFHIDLDDYLMGLLQLASELVGSYANMNKLIFNTEFQTFFLCLFFFLLTEKLLSDFFNVFPCISLQLQSNLNSWLIYHG